MNQLLGHSTTYRIAVGLRQGRKVLTLQALPACESDGPFADLVGKVARLPSLSPSTADPCATTRCMPTWPRKPTNGKKLELLFK